MDTNLLIVVRVGQNMATYFPEAAMAEIGKLARVTVLDTDGRTEADLAPALVDVDVCMTHWGCTRVTTAVLGKAPGVKLIAHCAGSVANIASDAKRRAFATSDFLRQIPADDQGMSRDCYV